jgi:hypothetical protein
VVCYTGCHRNSVRKIILVAFSQRSKRQREIYAFRRILRMHDFRLPSRCEISALPSSYAVLFNTYLPTLRDSLSFPSSRVNQSDRLTYEERSDCFTLEDGTDKFFRNVCTYHTTLHNNPEERRLWIFSC